MKCPLIDYKKNYKAIAIDILAKIGIGALIAIFACWCAYMA